MRSADSDLGDFTGTVSTTDGKKLAQLFLRGKTLTVRVSEKLALPADAPPVKSFLIPRVLDAMWNREHIDSYEILRSNAGYLTAIQIDLGGQQELSAERRLKDLTNAITWTLRRLAEKAHQT